MPDSNTTTSDAFGVFTTVTGLTDIAILNNLRYGESSDIAEARNENGKVVKRKAYSRTITVNGDGVLKTQTIPPEAVRAGKSIVINSGTFMIESVEINEANTDYTKFSFSAKTADAATITEYSAS